MHFVRTVALGFLAAASLSVNANAAESLDAGFANPPQQARPLVWWHWINGNITERGIDEDLADMKRVGIAGAQMFDVSIYLPPGPVRYRSDAWYAAIQHAIATADKLGLEFYMMNTPGWSASGGPWVTPERSMKQIVWSEAATQGGTEISAVLPQPPTKLGFYRDVAVLAVPADTAKPPLRVADLAAQTKMAEKSLSRTPLETTTPGAIPRDQVLNLTKDFNPNTQTVRAALPPGAWTILRFGFTTTGSTNHPAQPEGHGLEIDKMDAAAVSFYFDQALGRVIKEAGNRAGRTFRGILFDSFEGGPQNWTADFPKQFAALKGYDLIPFLPALAGRVIESRTLTDCFLHDFRSAVEQSIAQNYFGTMQRRAHEHGMVVYAEAQGGPLNPMLCDRYVDVPMNEFWMPDSSARAPRMRMVASISDLLGRPIVGAESFTAKPEDGAWQAVPSTLKNPGDLAWTTGINRFILHHYVHQPADYGPGFALGRYGTEFGRLNSWWPLAGTWISYVARSQFLLQQGRTVADICFLQNEDHGYSFPSAMVEVPPGYTYDICYPRHLQTMQWRDGALRGPNGTAFRTLVLPQNWAADLPTLRHLRDLVRAGAPIFGAAPVAPAGVQDYERRDEFAALIAELWGHRLIHPSAPLGAALHEFRIDPDVAWATTPGTDFQFIHRRAGETDIYFVFNHSAEAITADVTFRSAGRQPELWNAITGTHADAPVFSPGNGTTTLPLQFEPHGSKFVVFRRKLPSRWVQAVTPAVTTLDDGRMTRTAEGPTTVTYSDGQTRTIPAAPSAAPIEVGGAWPVTFTDGRGAPAHTTFVTLHSWAEDPNEGIKYYSGTAVYQTTFAVPAMPRDSVAMLDLGTVADLAEVKLNGHSLGVLWQPPFVAEVTHWLRVGSNTLEVRVANRWINRVIGDEHIPTDLKYQPPGTNKFTDGRLLNLPAWLYDPSKLSEKKRQSFTTWQHYTAESPLVPSGLLGPVRIEWRQVLSP